MSEQDYARMETAMNDFVDAYFKARSRQEVRLVVAGFKFAWNKRDEEIDALRQQLEEAQRKLKAVTPQVQPASPERTSECLVNERRAILSNPAEQRLAYAEGQEAAVSVTSTVDEIDAQPHRFIDSVAERLTPAQRVSGHIERYSFHGDGGAQPNGGVIALWEGTILRAITVTLRDEFNRTKCVKADFLRATPPATDERDTERLDWLQEQAESGHISMCFELDGGVHVTLDPVGEEQRSVRSVSSIRDGIDAIAASKGEKAP